METGLTVLCKQFDEIRYLNDKDYLFVMQNNHERLVNFFSGIFKVGTKFIDCKRVYSTHGATLEITELQNSFDIKRGRGDINVIFYTEYGMECRYAETLFYELLNGTIKIKE